MDGIRQVGAPEVRHPRRVVNQLVGCRLIQLPVCKRQVEETRVNGPPLQGGNGEASLATGSLEIPRHRSLPRQ